MSGRRVAQLCKHGSSSNQRGKSLSPSGAGIVAGIGDISNTRLCSDLASSQVWTTPPAPTERAKTVTCSTCNGHGFVDVDGLLNTLQRLPRPHCISFSLPGAAPKGTRWVCQLCSGKKQIKKGSADLRTHLAAPPHSFPEHDIEVVFDPKHPLKLYQHFGPCTPTQAAANGWRVRSWNEDDGITKTEQRQQPRGLERSREIFYRQLGLAAAGSLFARPKSNIYDGSTLQNTPMLEIAIDVTTRDESVEDEARGVDCDASNDYFGAHHPDHELPLSSVLLPDAGDQFDDSPLTELNDIASGIQEFPSSEEAGPDQHSLQGADAMLGVLEAPTSWISYEPMGGHGVHNHSLHQVALEPFAEGDGLSNTRTPELHCCLKCGEPYATSMPIGSEMDEFGVEMIVAEVGEDYSFTADLESVD